MWKAFIEGILWGVAFSAGVFLFFSAFSCWLRLK
jgi:hypothetical protein